MSTDKPFDPWATSSGLPLDGADVTIVEFAFGSNARIPNSENQTFANIKFVLDDGGDEQEQSYSLGEGWVVTPGGESVSGADKPRNVGGGSNWGGFFTAAANVVEAQTGSHIREVLPETNPLEAAGWIGTRWSLGGKQLPSFKGKDGKMVDRKPLIVPAAYLGTADAAITTAAATTAATATTTAAAVKPKAGGKATLKDTDAELYTVLLELAGTFDDNDDFMAAALERDDVDGNALAINAVMDQKPTSLFNIAQANKA